MHYHCEVIMPPAKDIEEALSQIMAPFNENANDKYSNGHPFWDYFVSGGRFAGTKEMCTYSEDKIIRFYKMLQENKVTVCSLQCGKQEISPASQIPMVDNLWNELFPTENGEIVPCPLFAHSNNQYDGDDLISCDICRVEEIPSELKCSRVIIAGPDYKDEKLEAKFMICDEEWNGVNHMPIAWDGKVKSAIDMFLKYADRYREEYKEKVTPKDNWICITVDYHS